ncbi:bifunctional GTP diphosphokinase/guanosine-3',5'-bis(diphosphate) 3'-diphosphatase [Thiocapsa imhoffii]|uniref:guanosine-3',5'-bis(diphosphate) 3'-diphosphatase n=1 Tax=Thiocapsa imhoffii TaxID=382777 RepID=A0A9X0WEX6_9GAMM|nr:RelA/SpoT family protein [Thiocapsa imhoffii]MBK1643271.1 bifunctional GTP diphosphokinase/guanosine-3',5'-bis(diphosphate) 3'-diphosphatase [Thiocapsa imhoffii]
MSDLCADLSTYLPPEQISEIYRAYLFGAEAHDGQTRKSGEPYIYHPVAVARILGEMRMDYQCLIAAILHDVIEDTGVTKEQVADAFGPQVAELVDGVSKLSQIQFESRAEAQAASLQKMLLAMTRDIRVILIKLADRLHNMRTLDAMKPEACRRISRETLEIFAPIANRLGIDRMRVELEELGFLHYWPWRRGIIQRALRKTCGARLEMVSTVETELRRAMLQEDLAGEVEGRRKHLYGIYCKMREKHRAFSEVVDVFGFRVTVDRIDTCYRVLGLAHNLYKPVPGRFKDYIAIPKANGYQSLHSVLVGPQGIHIEIQIRTHEMQRMAESGIAAHWMYKTGEQGTSNTPALAAEWLQNLLVMQRGAGDSVEFLEHVKVDLFPDEVYVFTPKGRIMTLKRGATVIDFAYAIHSDVGNSCVAARIDRQMVSLDTMLRSGQTVEIFTSPGKQPNAAWLNFVVTGKARASIRGYLKNLKQREAIELGRRLLANELAPLGVTLEQIDPLRVAAYLEDANQSSLDDLLVEIGLGNRLAAFVARRLVVMEEDEINPERGGDVHPHRLAIRGTEGIVVSFARCCRPIPGDPIAALFSPGRGIVVHRIECRNLGSLESRRDTRLEVEWADEPDGEYPTEIRVEVGNRRGALAVVANAISDLGSNIENVFTREKDGMTTALDLMILVRSRVHLARIMRRVRQLPVVLRITRVPR